MTNLSKLAKLFLKNCVGCGACVEICPHNAIPETLIGFISSLAIIDKLKCGGCGECIRICSHNAIELVNGIASIDNIQS